MLRERKCWSLIVHVEQVSRSFSPFLFFSFSKVICFLKIYFFSTMLPNQCFPNNYDPCHHIACLFSERFDSRVSDIQNYPELWVCEGGEGLEWPAGRFIHLSWLTRPTSLPLPFFHPFASLSPSSGTSSIRVKIRTAGHFARLEFFDPAPTYDPRAYTWIAPYMFVIRAVWTIRNYD